MEKKTSSTWKDYLLTLPQFNSVLKRVSEMVKASDIPIWLTFQPKSLHPVLVDFLSNSLKQNLSVFILREDVSDEDVISFDFSSILRRKEDITCGVGSTLSDILKILENFKYEKVNKVWGEGEYSVVGDTVSIWMVGNGNPLRLEFEDEKVSKVSVLEPESRRNIKSIKKFSFSDDKDLKIFNTYKSLSFYDVSNKVSIIVSDRSFLEDEISFKFKQLSFDFKSTKWDYSSVKKRIKEGWSVLFVVNHNLNSAEEIKEGIPEIKIFEEDLDEGFESKEMKLMVLTDYEMWGTVKISKLRHEKYSGLSLDEITPGDFVVHEDHGVAYYSGIKEEFNKGILQKYVELKYAQKDRLLVPLTQLQKVTKYVGSGTKKPKLTRLSGGEWKRIKKRVTESVRKVALELLRLYATRDLARVSPISLMNGEVEKFESDFEFTETDDQLQAIQDVYNDLQKEKPMDRLLVGDVGFGKTEVAMRAAFISVLNGKQVAVLAPTTILVEQHYQVFKSRMEKYGIKVACLSRFLDRKESELVIKDLKSGDLDVVIGTHRLLSSDVKYKNLGLLVIDEEQKFGVSQKEKIKNKKLDVHVLSMSATPIPRTLNMALSGVRDISIISTAPLGRIPIKNYVRKFNWKDVVAAIENEVKRGGQVYFVHNRVETIGFVYEKLKNLLPKVRFVIGHGQMSSEKLSKAIRDFNEGRYDVLICSTIIENGLDMPNVNTLVIDRAEMFGLSQLYQIRGRIGRGNRQAYAYFFYYGTGGQKVVKQAVFDEEKDIISEEGEGILWENARERLQAIKELEELGSGFDLAQRDLEIRGAGNFLGKEQHGNVNAIGFSLYCRLLSEMVDKLK